MKIKYNYFELSLKVIKYQNVKKSEYKVFYCNKK